MPDDTSRAPGEATQKTGEVREPDLTQMRDPLGLLRLGYAQPLLQHTALRWNRGAVVEGVETIAEEVPVALVYNGSPHVVMMATPSDLDDFALGFSITEELLPSPADLKSVEVIRYSRGIELQLKVSPECEAEINSRSRRLVGRTGCGICGADSIAGVLKQLHPVNARTIVKADAIHRAMLQLDQRQELNRSAGAVHAAAWATSNGDVVLLREDVGRHNALDKLIGGLFKLGTDPDSGFVLVTSRASFEMVQKATAFGASLLASISGPTGLAVRVAQQAGLTLVGFTRPDRHTVYTHAGRVSH